jgi:hypothetical protein
VSARRASGVNPPTLRSLQVFALDPSLELDVDTAHVNRSVIQVDWEEELQPGPVGEYLEVIDVDPPSRSAYLPVDLNHPHLLAQDGLSPSEGNPQFHQQMVYAVAMKTIANFEQALGRSVHWSPRHRDEAGEPVRDWQSQFVPKLRIYPHALREANAYYSAGKKALLFGYFNAQNTDAAEGLPGGLIFTCLSHDIIAHEMTHAILDGIHRRLLEPTNPDTLAFHEAFADLVAIFQHFTLPGVLEHQIAQTRGDLATENLLAKLAIQFGRATRRRNALRDALGEVNPATGLWERRPADPTRIAHIFEPHARGALLVAAIFDAFLAIYKRHAADLLRIASGGTGILADGALHPDLVQRLAGEARTVAQRVLTMCLRALDYLPPVDVTFGDYVRALITIDADLVPNDPRRYRAAFITALRDRGIYPRDVRTLSVESLRWQPPTEDEQELLKQVLPPPSVLRLMTYANDFPEGHAPYLGRPEDATADEVGDLDELTWQLLQQYQDVTPAGERSKQQTSLAPHSDGQPSPADLRRWDEFRRERQFAWYWHQYLQTRVRDPALAGRAEQLTDLLGIDLFASERKFEVHAVRPTSRVRRDGRTKEELLVLMTQRHPAQLEFGADWGEGNYFFRSGCTILIDPVSAEVRYVISKRKSDTSAGRQARQAAYLRDRLQREGLDARSRYGVWIKGDRDRTRRHEPFRLLHQGPKDEDWI